jgi:hypothetical protein
MGRSEGECRKEWEEGTREKIFVSTREMEEGTRVDIGRSKR